jgi:hypothetical protein
MSTPVSGSLLDHFTALKDPRQRAKVLSVKGNPAPGVLGDNRRADDFVGDTPFGEGASGIPQTVLPIESGIPSHGTLCCDLARKKDPV